MYDLEDPWMSEARRRHLLKKAKLCIATFIRYLATKSDQHAIGKEFGIRQPAVSKRIRKAVHAILSAYSNTGCPDPKIVFPTEAERLRSSDFFFERTGGIPYLMGIIDGTIILIYKPDGENYIPAEFYNSRKGYYGINCMIICDHRKRIIFCES
jgi:hypothetical protein